MAGLRKQPEYDPESRKKGPICISDVVEAVPPDILAGPYNLPMQGLGQQVRPCLHEHPNLFHHGLCAKFSLMGICLTSACDIMCPDWLNV